MCRGRGEQQGKQQGKQQSSTGGPPRPFLLRVGQPGARFTPLTPPFEGLRPCSPAQSAHTPEQPPRPARDGCRAHDPCASSRDKSYGFCAAGEGITRADGDRALQLRRRGTVLPSVPGPPPRVARGIAQRDPIPTVATARHQGHRALR